MPRVKPISARQMGVLSPHQKACFDCPPAFPNCLPRSAASAFFPLETGIAFCARKFRCWTVISSVAPGNPRTASSVPIIPGCAYLHADQPPPGIKGVSAIPGVLGLEGAVVHGGEPLFSTRPHYRAWCFPYLFVTRGSPATFQPSMSPATCMILLKPSLVMMSMAPAVRLPVLQ